MENSYFYRPYGINSALKPLLHEGLFWYMIFLPFDLVLITSHVLVGLSHRILIDFGRHIVLQREKFQMNGC